MEQGNRHSWIMNIIIVFLFVVVGFIVLYQAEPEQENVITAENLTTLVRPTSAPVAEPVETGTPTFEPTISVEAPTAAAVISTVCRPPAGWGLYYLQPDQSLRTILRTNRITLAELLQANCLTGERITAVDKLFLPPPTQTVQPTSSPVMLGYSPPANPSLGSSWIRPSDNMIMLYVPAGSFQMGSDPTVDDYAEDDEMPQHKVTLDSYWIDETEVTNEQYESCVAEGACIEAGYVNDRDFNGNLNPVVGIDWYDAQDYCRWAGGTLPAEAQWEYAARGNDGRLYPWGNGQPNCTIAQFDSCLGDTVPVKSLSVGGNSWVGAVGMAGNAAEWVADWYDSRYYSYSPEINPTGPETGKFKVVRGSYYTGYFYLYRSALRRYIMPTTRYAYYGFRCIVP